jgi:transcription antitermination protein NusB
MLYEDDMNPQHSLVASDRFLRQRLRQDPELIEFASQLVAGVRRNRQELDRLLAARAENWSLRRMAVTDRNVLRLGAFEILFTDTPNRVAIDEAVNLARRYGAQQSAPFVNGILDRFLQPSADPPDSDATTNDNPPAHH